MTSNHKGAGRLGASILPASARAAVSTLRYQRDATGAGTRGVRSALSACLSAVSAKGMKPWGCTGGNGYGATLYMGAGGSGKRDRKPKSEARSTHDGGRDTGSGRRGRGKKSLFSQSALYVHFIASTTFATRGAASATIYDTVFYVASAHIVQSHHEIAHFSLHNDSI